MPNPTGTVYLQANNSYVWTDGDVYQIPQTDQSEGAATGASFAGLGVDNQPHQALLNKAQLLHKNQLADEANISALQTILTLTSAVGLNGWMKLSSNDVNLGQIYPILQWGTISVLPYGGSSNKPPMSVSLQLPDSLSQCGVGAVGLCGIEQRRREQPARDYLHADHAAAKAE